MATLNSSDNLLSYPPDSHHTEHMLSNGGENPHTKHLAALHETKHKSISHTVSCHNAVDLLIVGVTSVPREPVPQVWIGLKHAFKHKSFNNDTQVHYHKLLRQLIRSQLDQDCRHVARRLTAAIDEVNISSWNGQTLL